MRLPWKIVGERHFANNAIGTDGWLRLRHRVNSNSLSKVGELPPHLGLAAAATLY